MATQSIVSSTFCAHALAWNFTLDRLSKMRGLDPVVFDRAGHDEAWGCAYSRVWRAYLDVIREAAWRRRMQASALLANLLANALRSPKYRADRRAPFPRKSHDRKSTVT